MLRPYRTGHVPRHHIVQEVQRRRRRRRRERGRDQGREDREPHGDDEGTAGGKTKRERNQRT